MGRNESNLVLVLMIHRYELEYQDDGTHDCREKPESLVSIPSV